MKKRITVFIDNQQSLLLASLLKKYGGTASHLITSLLREKYDSAFPPYKGKSSRNAIEALIPRDELTKEQLCEQIIGGKVVKMDNGDIKCEYRDGAFLTKVPLSMVGTEDCDPVSINLNNEKIKNKNPKF